MKYGCAEGLSANFTDPLPVGNTLRHLAQPFI